MAEMRDYSNRPDMSHILIDYAWESGTKIKLIQFPQVEAEPKEKPKVYPRLVRLELMYSVFWWITFLAERAGIEYEDVLLDSHVFRMRLGLLYPLFCETYPILHNAKLTHDIITVEHRPAEDEAVINAQLKAIWAERERVVLSSFHRILMNAEKKVMLKSESTMPVIDETGYVSHVVASGWIRREIQKLLGSQGIIIGIQAIKRELAVISYAYEQSEAMGFPVKFERAPSLQKSLQRAA
jgi:hypothetical protein